MHHLADFTCNPRKFRCKNGQCIPINDRCSGRAICLDGSDEIDCGKLQLLIQ